MKQILFLFFLLTVFFSYGQVTATITPVDTTLCYHDSIAIHTQVTGLRPYTYKWLKNGVVIANASDSILVFKDAKYPDTAVYQCIVGNGSSVDTSNTSQIRMHLKMNIDALYRYNALGCPGSSKGQFKAHVSGGAPPYTYEWGGGHSQDTIVFGLGEGKYTFIVTDTNHCSLDSIYEVEVLKIPKVVLATLPKDTVYLSNPTVLVSFPDSSLKHMTNWTWNFGDSTEVPNVNPASHVYKKSWRYIIVLKFTDANGCEDTANIQINVRIAELKIPNVFTPDHDPSHLNETFMITIKENPTKNFNEAYLSNELVILDRWGKTVYSKTNYSSNSASGEWDGEKLSDGIYFYLLKCHGYYSDEVFKGTVTILRSH